LITSQFALASVWIFWFHRRPGITIPALPPPQYILSDQTPKLPTDKIVPFEQEKPWSRYPGNPMKSDLLDKASEVVTDPLVLINLVSKRVRQLNSGRSPLIPTVPSMGAADIALTEIIEGKIKLIGVGVN